MSEFDDKLNKVLSSPEDMEKIMSIARSFTGSSGASTESGGDTSQAMPDLGAISSAFSNLDPKLIRLISRLASEYSSGKNDKSALLTAIKPYLREDRHAKIDRAAELAKLAKLAKLAFSEYTRGDESV